MAKIGVFIFIDDNKIAVNEIQYANRKLAYASAGVPMTEDKGIFHKWLYVKSEDIRKAQERGVVFNF